MCLKDISGDVFYSSCQQIPTKIKTNKLMSSIQTLIQLIQCSTHLNYVHKLLEIHKMSHIAALGESFCHNNKHGHCGEF